MTSKDVSGCDTYVNRLTYSACSSLIAWQLQHPHHNTKEFFKKMERLNNEESMSTAVL